MPPMTATPGASESAHERLHHLGIVVPKEGYAALLRGACRWFDSDIVDEGEDDELDIHWAWVNGPGGVLIEAVAPRSGHRTAITRFLARTGGGLHHVSFETTALTSCAGLLHERDAVTVGHREDHGGWAEFFMAPDQLGGARLHWMQAVTEP